MIRRWLYYFYCAGWTILLGLPAFPLYFIKKQFWVYRLSALWERGLMAGLKYIVGIDYRIIGIENLPPPPYVLAIKHQSAMETLLLSIHFYNPCIILKKELLKIPIMGGYLRAAENIAIDRSLGTESMLQMVKSMKKEIKRQRVLVIFPEGTRSQVGKGRPYHAGVYMMGRLGVPVFPVALNTGCFWQKNKFSKGTAEIAILPPMPDAKKMTKDAYLTELQKRIEMKTRQLEENALIQ